MTSDKIIIANNGTFDEIIKGDKPVLVDFWAEWCGPCRMVAPVLDELAEELEEKVTICKLDIDTNQDIANRYDVRSIPTFIIFKDGQVADRMMGAMPKSAFKTFIARNL